MLVTEGGVSGDRGSVCQLKAPCRRSILDVGIVSRVLTTARAFLQAVPRPVAMQLATKEVQVSLDDDPEGDDDDGNAWLRVNAGYHYN